MAEFLIQHPEDSKFHFGWEDGEAGWTADIKRAIRSETREEAEEFANNIGLADWLVVPEFPFQEKRPPTGAAMGFTDDEKRKLASGS